MHGLIHRSIEAFLRDSHGDSFWHRICQAAGHDTAGVMPTYLYPDELTHGLISCAAAELGITNVELVEDIGAWLALFEPVRRLLRFGGAGFADFLLSLEEMPDRVEMVAPGIGVPHLSVVARSVGLFEIRAKSTTPLWLAMLSGLLRAMADDYGALVLIEVEQGVHHMPVLKVNLLAAEFARAREFSLVVNP